jgi:Tfp pilus assembly protein PilN
MIKVNLLPQKRAKRATMAAGRHAPQQEDGTKAMLIGIGGLAAAAAAVFFLFDKPKRDEIAQLKTSNEQLSKDIATKQIQLKDYESLKKSADEIADRYKSIRRLLNTKVVPAHVLHELGTILTPHQPPTMTKDMADKTSSGEKGDPNRRFQLDWDPTHVWLSGFTDTDGVFKLEGGAASESDVTQLSKRLQASVYFSDVTPAGGERVADTQSGMTYYRFTITGKVAY